MAKLVALATSTFVHKSILKLCKRKWKLMRPTLAQYWVFLSQQVFPSGHNFSHLSQVYRIKHKMLFLSLTGLQHPSWQKEFSGQTTPHSPQFLSSFSYSLYASKSGEKQWYLNILQCPLHFSWSSSQTQMAFFHLFQMHLVFLAQQILWSRGQTNSPFFTWQRATGMSIKSW